MGYRKECRGDSETRRSRTQGGTCEATEQAEERMKPRPGLAAERVWVTSDMGASIIAERNVGKDADGRCH